MRDTIPIPIIELPRKPDGLVCPIVRVTNCGGVVDSFVLQDAHVVVFSSRRGSTLSFPATKRNSILPPFFEIGTKRLEPARPGIILHLSSGRWGQSWGRAVRYSLPALF